MSKVVFSVLMFLLVIVVFVDAVHENNKLAMYGWGLLAAGEFADLLKSTAKYLKKKRKIAERELK